MLENLLNKINIFKKDKEEIKKDINVLEKPWQKWYGNIPDTLNYFQGSIYDFLCRDTSKYINDTAIEYFKYSMTFKELINEIDYCASALVKSGIKENDIVTICTANTPEAVIAFYAINKIGAVANMVHPLSSINEIKDYIISSNTKLVFINDMLYKKILSIQKDINVKKVVIIPISNKMDFITKILYNLTNKFKVNESNLTDEFELWDSFVDTHIIDTHINRSSNDDAVILYSGGTTGKSKGVVLSNLCFNALTEECHAMIKETKIGNSMLSYLPIFHGFGLGVCIHAPLGLGMKCILIPKLNTKKVNKVIKNKKPNFVPVIPSLLNIIIKDDHLSKNALKSVVSIVSGGDYLPLDLKEKSEKYFRDHGSRADIRVGFGLTECTACTTASPVENYKNGSIGIPFPDNYYKIVKPNTHITADYEEIGEICISGPTVMKRYLNNEEETYKTLRTHDDGRLWLHTGDLGYMDKDGIFYFSTRLKRMIISNGINIYPSSLEEIFNKHPYIESSVVIGINDKVKVQAVKVIIILKENIKLNDDVKDDIKKYAKENISKFALPSEYEFTNEFPKTKIGKIDFRKLQKGD